MINVLKVSLPFGLMMGAASLLTPAAAGQNASQPFMMKAQGGLISVQGDAPCAIGPGLPTGQSPVYYVSSTGSNSNSGLSSTSPYATIGKALSKALGGAVIVVMPGNYSETVEIMTPGRPGACTTLIGLPGATMPVLSSPSANYGTVNVWAPYVRVSGLAITHVHASNDAIGVWGSTTTDASGALRPVVHHVQIDNTIDYNAGCGGIDVSDTDYVLIEANTTYGNGNLDPAQCSGISIYEAINFDNASGYHNQIINNISYANQDMVPAPGRTNTTDGNGIIIDDFRRNQSDHVAYQSGTLILGNLVFGNGGRGIHVFSSDNVDVINNTAYYDLNDPKLVGYPATGEELSINTASHVRFINNIVSARTATLPAISQTPASWQTADNAWIDNLIGVGYIEAASIDSGTTFSGTISGVDPGFVAPSTNPVAANFSLAGNSPALLNGDPLDISVVDMWGNSAAAGDTINRGADMESAQ